MVITSHRRLHAVLLTCLALVATVSVTAQKNDQSKDSAKQLEAKRPKVTVRAQPPVGVAPFRVVLTGELQGGSDDLEEYYCPTIEWAWGDDTTSESTLDCEPYEAGKSQIKRRFTVRIGDVEKEEEFLKSRSPLFRAELPRALPGAPYR